MGFARNVAFGIKDFLSAPSRSISKVLINFFFVDLRFPVISGLVTFYLYAKLDYLNRAQQELFKEWLTEPQASLVALFML